MQVFAVVPPPFEVGIILDRGWAELKHKSPAEVVKWVMATDIMKIELELPF
jgi:hypothetical protein